MNVIRKTGVLLVLLAVPVLLYLFLRNFGQNHYEVPVYYQDGVAATDCPANDSIHTIPSFSLQQADDSQRLDETDLDNRITAVYLFSMPCDSACQQVMEELARVQDVFEKEETVQLLAVSSSEADVPGLKSLAQKFNSRPARWKFLTGSPEAVQMLRQCGLVLDQQKEVVQPVVLIDGERKIRGYYTGTDAAEIDRLVLEIRILLYNVNQENA